MKKTTVGIMTFHWAPNYGALLQTWALQEFLLQNGYEAEIIDFVPKKYRITLLRCFIAKRLDTVKKRWIEYNREKKVKSFRENHLNISHNRFGHKSELKKNPPIYDYYVSGSDQIWNPPFTMRGQNGVTLSYFLDFAPQGRKKFAFASSFGRSSLPDEMLPIIKRELETFSAVSVREETGADILQSIGIDAVCISDPTLLFDAKQYESLLPDEKQETAEIFQFMLHGQESIGRTVSSQIAGKYNLPVCDENMLTVEQWLSKIRNAAFVVTNSYHCVVFSLLFHRPFLAIDVKGSDMSSRLTTLLKRVGLEDRFLRVPVAVEQVVELTDIDWNDVDTRLQKTRLVSQQFILNALNHCSRIDDIPKSRCVGCGLCAAVCPQNCISLQEDERGFLHPIIDESKCINCGLCSKKCVVNQPISEAADEEPPATYACYHRDPDIRQNSSSGGAFSALAEAVFDENGIVYGARFDGKLHLMHAKAEHKEELERLRGSKYMPSAAYPVFKEIRSYLQAGRQVLFCGTPCQVAALSNFVNNHENLLCVDLACHGIPSMKVLREKCDSVTKSCGSTVESIQFRNKRTGWKSFTFVYSDGNDQEIHSEWARECDFMIGYIDNLFIRESCERCMFAKIPRMGDITLADCWYKAQNGSDLEDKGISAVLVNSPKGKAFFEAAQKNLHTEEIPLEDLVKGTPTLVKGCEPNKRKWRFWKKMNRLGFKNTMNVYCFRKRTKSIIKRKLLMR